MCRVGAERYANVRGGVCFEIEVRWAVEAVFLRLFGRFVAPVLAHRHASKLRRPSPFLLKTIYHMFWLRGAYVARQFASCGVSPSSLHATSTFLQSELHTAMEQSRPQNLCFKYEKTSAFRKGAGAKPFGSFIMSCFRKDIRRFTRSSS